MDQQLLNHMILPIPPPAVAVAGGLSSSMDMTRTHSSPGRRTLWCPFHQDLRGRTPRRDPVAAVGCDQHQRTWQTSLRLKLPSKTRQKLRCFFICMYHICFYTHVLYNINNAHQLVIIRNWRFSSRYIPQHHCFFTPALHNWWFHGLWPSATCCAIVQLAAA